MSIAANLNCINDEDLLRQMWQETEDFGRKKEIRAHMYKLRETRLRDFYSGDMDAGIGLTKTPLTGSHGDSLADQSFQSFKTKEIRDSESPTREFKYGVPSKTGGWNVMTSSEISSDGKKHTTHTLATTGGVHDISNGKATFAGQNEKLSSVMFDGDDKNFTTSTGQTSKTVLEENIATGDKNNKRIESNISSTISSSSETKSKYTSEDDDAIKRHKKIQNEFDQLINTDANKSSSVNTQEQNERFTNNNQSKTQTVYSTESGQSSRRPSYQDKDLYSTVPGECVISKTVEYPDNNTKVIKEVKTLPDGSTVTTTKYETRAASSNSWSNASNKQTSSTSRVITEDHANRNRVEYILNDNRRIVTDNYEEKSLINDPYPKNNTFITSNDQTIIKQKVDNEEIKLISEDFDRKNIRIVPNKTNQSVNDQTIYNKDILQEDLIDNINISEKNLHKKINENIIRHNLNDVDDRKIQEEIHKTVKKDLSENMMKDIHFYDVKNIRVEHTENYHPENENEKPTSYHNPNDYMPQSHNKDQTETIKTQVEKKYVNQNQTESTRKRISVDLDPSHEAFARTLRCTSPISDRGSIRSHRTSTSSLRSSSSPDKTHRSNRSQSRETVNSDVSRFSSNTVTKSYVDVTKPSDPRKPAISNVKLSNQRDKVEKKEQLAENVVKSKNISKDYKQPRYTSPAKEIPTSNIVDNADYNRQPNNLSVKDIYLTQTNVTRKATEISSLKKPGQPKSGSPFCTNKKDNKTVFASDKESYIVTDLDSDENIKINKTNIVKKDELTNKKQRPPYMRSETYEERCRMILGMSEKNEDSLITKSKKLIDNEKTSEIKSRPKYEYPIPLNTQPEVTNVKLVKSNEITKKNVETNTSLRKKITEKENITTVKKTNKTSPRSSTDTSPIRKIIKKTSPRSSPDTSPIRKSNNLTSPEQFCDDNINAKQIKKKNVTENQPHQNYHLKNTPDGINKKIDHNKNSTDIKKKHIMKEDLVIKDKSPIRQPFRSKTLPEPKNDEDDEIIDSKNTTTKSIHLKSNSELNKKGFNYNRPATAHSSDKNIDNIIITTNETAMKTTTKTPLDTSPVRRLSEQKTCTRISPDPKRVVQPLSSKSPSDRKDKDVEFFENTVITKSSLHNKKATAVTTKNIKEEEITKSLEKKTHKSSPETGPARQPSRSSSPSKQKDYNDEEIENCENTVKRKSSYRPTTNVTTEKCQKIPDYKSNTEDITTNVYSEKVIDVNTKNTKQETKIKTFEKPSPRSTPDTSPVRQPTRSKSPSKPRDYDDEEIENCENTVTTKSSYRSTTNVTPKKCQTIPDYKSNTEDNTTNVYSEKVTDVNTKNTKQETKIKTFEKTSPRSTPDTSPVRQPTRSKSPSKPRDYDDEEIENCENTVKTKSSYRSTTNVTPKKCQTIPDYESNTEDNTTNVYSEKVTDVNMKNTKQETKIKTFQKTSPRSSPDTSPVRQPTRSKSPSKPRDYDDEEIENFENTVKTKSSYRSTTNVAPKKCQTIPDYESNTEDNTTNVYSEKVTDVNMKNTKQETKIKTFQKTSPRSSPDTSPVRQPTRSKSPSKPRDYDDEEIENFENTVKTKSSYRSTTNVTPKKCQTIPDYESNTEDNTTNVYSEKVTDVNMKNTKQETKIKTFQKTSPRSSPDTSPVRQPTRSKSPSKPRDYDDEEIENFENTVKTKSSYRSTTNVTPKKYQTIPDYKSNTEDNTTNVYSENVTDVNMKNTKLETKIKTFLKTSPRSSPDTSPVRHPSSSTSPSKTRNYDEEEVEYCVNTVSTKSTVRPTTKDSPKKGSTKPFDKSNRSSIAPKVEHTQYGSTDSRNVVVYNKKVTEKTSHRSSPDTSPVRQPSKSRSPSKPRDYDDEEIYRTTIEGNTVNVSNKKITDVTTSNTKEGKKIKITEKTSPRSSPDTSPVRQPSRSKSPGNTSDYYEEDVEYRENTVKTKSQPRQNIKVSPKMGPQKPIDKSNLYSSAPKDVHPVYSTTDDNNVITYNKKVNDSLINNLTQKKTIKTSEKITNRSPLDTSPVRKQSRSRSPTKPRDYDVEEVDYCENKKTTKSSLRPKASSEKGPTKPFDRSNQSFSASRVDHHNQYGTTDNINVVVYNKKSTNATMKNITQNKTTQGSEKTNPRYSPGTSPERQPSLRSRSPSYIKDYDGDEDNYCDNTETKYLEQKRSSQPKVFKDSEEDITYKSSDINLQNIKQNITTVKNLKLGTQFVSSSVKIYDTPTKVKHYEGDDGDEVKHTTSIKLLSNHSPRNTPNKSPVRKTAEPSNKISEDRKNILTKHTRENITVKFTKNVSPKPSPDASPVRRSFNERLIKKTEISETSPKFVNDNTSYLGKTINKSRSHTSPNVSPTRKSTEITSENKNTGKLSSPVRKSGEPGSSEPKICDNNDYDREFAYSNTNITLKSTRRKSSQASPDTSPIRYSSEHKAKQMDNNQKFKPENSVINTSNTRVDHNEASKMKNHATYLSRHIKQKPLEEIIEKPMVKKTISTLCDCDGNLPKSPSSTKPTVRKPNMDSVDDYIIKTEGTAGKPKNTSFIDDRKPIRSEVTDKVIQIVPAKYPANSRKSVEITKTTSKINEKNIYNKVIESKIQSKKLPVTERKNTAPVYGSSKIEMVNKIGRSTSDQLIKAPSTASLTFKKIQPKIEVFNSKIQNSEELPKVTHKSKRPNKCITTKTINITNKQFHTDEMDNIVIDFEQAKSSREPTPNKMIPVPVSPDEDTGPSRYPDQICEPDDELPKHKKQVRNIPIYEEESNDYVGCNITEYTDDSETETKNKSDINKITESDECLLSVLDKVSKFNTAVSNVTTKTNKEIQFTPNIERIYNSSLKSDDCLLSVSDKVNKFISTVEEIQRPKTSLPFKLDALPKLEDVENISLLNVTEKINIFSSGNEDIEIPREPFFLKTDKQDTNESLKSCMNKEEKYSKTLKNTNNNREVNDIDELKRKNYNYKTTDFKTYEEVTKSNKKNIINEEFLISEKKSSRNVADRYKPLSSPNKIASSPMTLQSTEIIKKAKAVFENKNQTISQKQSDILLRPSVGKYSVENQKEVKLTDIGIQNKTKDVQTQPENLKTRQIKQEQFKKTALIDNTNIKNIKHKEDINTILEVPSYTRKDVVSQRLFDKSNKVNSNTTQKNIDTFSNSIIDDITSYEKETKNNLNQNETCEYSYETDESNQYKEPNQKMPSYMSHTVSSYEHINRSKGVSPDRVNSETQSIDDDHCTVTKFGVDLKRVESHSVRRKSSSSEIPCIEEISDLELLEKMLETVVGYEQRRRIRSQIRIVKRQIKEMYNDVEVKRQRQKSPTAKINYTDSQVKTSQRTPLSTKLKQEDIFTQNIMTEIRNTKTESENTVNCVKQINSSSPLPSTKNVTTRRDKIVDNKDEKPIWATKNILKKPIESPRSIKAFPKKNEKTMSKTNCDRDSKITDCVTSSYGIGPTDEKGRPLFGIRALKKSTIDSQNEQMKETSVDDDDISETEFHSSYTTKIKTERKSPHEIREKLFERENSRKSFREESNPVEVKKESITTKNSSKTIKTLRRGSVKQLSDKLKSKEVSDENSDFQLIPNSETVRTTKYLSSRESTPASRYENEDYEKSLETHYCQETRTNTNTQKKQNKSFLNNESKVTGFHDVIERMRNADYVHEDGDTEEDREARALLNKFLGASMLITATESALPKQITTVTTRAGPHREVTTTKVTKTFKASSAPVEEQDYQIEDIWDERILKKILDKSTTYEERKRVRAQIRQIMAEKEACADIVASVTADLETDETSTKDNKVKDVADTKDDQKDEETGVSQGTTVKVIKSTTGNDQSVTTTTQVTTRTVLAKNAAKTVSPFAKFRQLDKQNSVPSSPKSPQTPTAPLFMFTDNDVGRRVSTVKDQLLQWCQMKTSEYENVKITNFSTSWTDGLAFCALIHHFIPDAFDYKILIPQQRRHNFELAFRVADEKAGIAPLLDVEDMVVMRKPDWKCVFTYVQSIHRRFRAKI